MVIGIRAKGISKICLTQKGNKYEIQIVGQKWSPGI
jgi:hypothetical protein